MLLNLLIAMLSSTYEKNHKEAQQGWKLHRASLIVRIDKSMSEKQRTSPDKVFWQTSPVDAKRRWAAGSTEGLPQTAAVCAHELHMFFWSRLRSFAATIAASKAGV